MESKVGRKYDEGKPDYSILPPAPIRNLVRVLMYGEKKYDRFNYLQLENGEERIYSACLRHLEAWREGERTDPESGLPHLSHALASILMLSHREEHHAEDSLPRRCTHDPLVWPEGCPCGW